MPSNFGGKPRQRKEREGKRVGGVLAARPPCVRPCSVQCDQCCAGEGGLVGWHGPSITLCSGCLGR